MKEKLSTIYLRSGQNALQYVMSLSEKYRQIATEAIFECLRLGYPLNDMEIEFSYSQLMAELFRLPKFMQLEIGKALIKNAKAGFDEDE